MLKALDIDENGGHRKMLDSLSVRVNIEEVIQRLQEMLDDEYITVEFEFIGGMYEEDSVIKLSAVDVIDNDKVEYGTLCYDNGEL